MFKKLLLSFLTSLILLQGSLTPALAQGQPAFWYDQNIFDWYVRVYDTETSPPQEIFGERYAAAQVQWVMYGLIVFTMNQFFSSEFTACMLGTASQAWQLNLPACVYESLIDSLDRFNDFINFMVDAIAPGANNFGQQPNLASNHPQSIGKDASLLSMMFQDRPISGVTYIKKTLNKLSPVQEVQAQEGFGFGALDALQDLWSASRNIAYGLLILVAIILALMVMLRTKIAPQTVITAQMAIPKIIMAAILITFSYAIAGFMIDLVYVVIGLIAAIFAPLFTPSDIPTIYSFLVEGPGAFGIWSMFFIYFAIISIAFPILLIATVGPIIIAAVAFSGGLGALLLIGILVIVVIYVLVMAVKILFMMAKTLVNIYLLVISAPLYILAGTIVPSLSFGSWLKALISNLAIFPMVGLMFMLAYVFIGYGSSSLPDLMQGVQDFLFTKIFGGELNISTDGAVGWRPPLIGGQGTGVGLLFMAISLSVLSLIPKAADIIKGMITGRPIAYGTAIGESFAIPLGMARSGVEGEAGYRAAMWGQRLQGSKNVVAQALGRTMLGYGEQRASVSRMSGTGEVGAIRRKGEAGA